MLHIFWPSLCFRVIGVHLFSGYRTNIEIGKMKNQFQEEEVMEQTAGVRGWVVRLVSRWLVREMEQRGKQTREKIIFSPVHELYRGKSFFRPRQL